MRKEDLVSVIIPVYNRADMAMQAIDASLSQDYKNIEIIVGDNCSTDGTFDKLKKRYSREENVLIFQNERNLGPVENWKRCLEKTNGKYVKVLWSDDLMSSDFISKAVDIMECDDNISFAFSSVIIFESMEQLKRNNDGEVKQFYRLKRKTGIYQGKEFIKAVFGELDSAPVSPGCAIFRREKLKVVSEIPNKLGYVHKMNGAGPDLLMYLEALVNGEKFAYIDEPCNFFRAHGDSISVCDKSILDGYRTAKIYYLKKYDMNNYWNDINSEIVSFANGRKVFNRDENIQALLKYYDIDDPDIFKHSVLSVIIYKLRIRLKKFNI